MLLLETHLERVFSVNLCEVIRNLYGRTDLVGWKEGVATEGL